MRLINILAFYVLISSLSFPVYSEEIRNFYSEMFISSDGSTSVQENIEYDFGYELRHGIFREIPHKYEIGIKNYNLRMNVTRVTDFEENLYNYKVSRERGRVIVRIGDPDKEITGGHDYRIEYLVSGSRRAGEGLTIVVGLPKGILKEPSSLKKALWFISDNWFFGLPILTLFFISYVWYTRGRDPEGKGVIAVRYEPPKDLTPAEAGTLMDERADILDITSTVIDLAVRGYINT